jgi:hypothetical protein
MFYVGDFNLFLKEIVKHMWNIPAMVQKLSITIYELYTYMQDMFFLLKIVLPATMEWNTWKGCKRFMDYIKENSPVITKFGWTVSRFYLLEVKHTHPSQQKNLLNGNSMLVLYVGSIY